MSETSLVAQEDRMWAAIAQLSPYVSTFIGPIIVLLIFQSRPFARFHAIQALALQGGLWICTIIISVIASATCGIGAILYLALLPFVLAPLWGAWKAWEGEWSGFPGLSKFGR